MHDFVPMFRVLMVASRWSTQPETIMEGKKHVLSLVCLVTVLSIACCKVFESLRYFLSTHSSMYHLCQHIHLGLLEIDYADLCSS